MGPLHDIWSLFHLWSFSHSACDAILAQRHVVIFDAFRPGKGPVAQDTVDTGLAFMLVFESIVGFFTYRAFRSDDGLAPRSLNGKLMLPFFAIVGLVGLGVQLHADAQYVDTCLGVLGN